MSLRLSAIRTAVRLGTLVLATPCLAQYSSDDTRPLGSNIPRSASSVTKSSVFEMPDVLGAPVAIVALELPKGALAETDQARFDIEFVVNLRGAVTSSKILASSRPDLSADVLKQHAAWKYAVATRQDPCVVKQFRAVQSLNVERRDGKMKLALDPAVVVAVLGTEEFELSSGSELGLKSNYGEVVSSMRYPMPGYREGVEASLAILAEFAEDGTVRDAFPVNSASDRWGFTATAVDAVKQVKLKEPTGKSFFACMPISFKFR